MKHVKRVISAVLCMALLLCLPFSASAATFDDTEDYIRFTPGKEKLTGNGDFTFNISQWVETVPFTANSSSLRINTSATIKDGSGSHIDPSVEFTVTLYKAANKQVVGSYRGYADGRYGGYTFTVVDGAKYYIRIAVAANSLYTGEKLNGSGNVSPITL